MFVSIFKIDRIYTNMNIYTEIINNKSSDHMPIRSEIFLE